MKYVAFGEAVRSADGTVVHEVEYGAKARNVQLANGKTAEAMFGKLTSGWTDITNLLALMQGIANNEDEVTVSAAFHSRDLLYIYGTYKRLHFTDGYMGGSAFISGLPAYIKPVKETMTPSDCRCYIGDVYMMRLWSILMQSGAGHVITIGTRYLKTDEGATESTESVPFTQIIPIRIEEESSGGNENAGE